MTAYTFGVRRFLCRGSSHGTKGSKGSEGSSSVPLSINCHFDRWDLCLMALSLFCDYVRQKWRNLVTLAGVSIESQDFSTFVQHGRLHLF